MTSTKNTNDAEDENDDEEDDESAIQKSNTTVSDDEEDDAEEDLQEYDSKRTQMTAPKIINVSPKKINNDTTESAKRDDGVMFSGSGSGSGSSSDIMSEAHASGSGSGDEGVLENDIKELTFLTGLNFQDDTGTGELDNEYATILSHSNSPIENTPSSEHHVRDEIEEPEDTSMDLYEVNETEEQAGDEQDESGSGSGNSEEEPDNDEGSTEETSKVQLYIRGNLNFHSFFNLAYFKCNDSSEITVSRW